MKRLLSCLLLLVALAPCTFAGETPQTISAAQFHADVVALREAIARRHPDPDFSADQQAMQEAFDRIGRDLPPALDRDEAWRRLATLNPLFADAHFVVGYPDWRSETRTWLAAGGSLFPLEVELQPDGRLFVHGDGAAAPARIVSVNGADAGSLVQALLARMHGDTQAFRTRLLADRWCWYYWKYAGAPERYRLVLEQGGRQRTVELPGSRMLPAILRDEAQFERQFSLSVRPGGLAVLTVGSFSQPDPARFLAFTRAAFARIRQEGVHTLVIDISRNGGGDDGMWLEGLMPYLANKPYRTGSTHRGFTRRATPDQVVDGEIATWREPQPKHPLHFEGKVFVHIGPGTYSSAILFANVMRDFGFATLVGEGGFARRSQSGGVRNTRLPHSGLVLTLPRFILDPPAGRAPGALLEAEALPPALLPLRDDILSKPI